MYTTDQTYQEQQKQQAQDVITNITQRYSENKKRLKELDWHRTIYQAFGDWQTAIDVLEEQMITWGRKEEVSNTELFEQYDAELKQRTVPHDKEEWDEKDYQSRGSAAAYSEARYAVRFLEVMAAITYLRKRRESLLNTTLDPLCSPPEVCKGRAEVDMLVIIVHQLMSWTEAAGGNVQ